MALRLAQFYRVEVRVLPPEGRGAERTRSVLRRFSHFTKLHAKARQLEALAWSVVLAVTVCYLKLSHRQLQRVTLRQKCRQTCTQCCAQM